MNKNNIDDVDEVYFAIAQIGKKVRAGQESEAMAAFALILANEVACKVKIKAAADKVIDLYC